MNNIHHLFVAICKFVKGTVHLSLLLVHYKLPLSCFPHEINKFREVEKAKEEGIIQFESDINLTKIMRSVQKRIRSFNKEPDKNIGNVEISPKS